MAATDGHAKNFSIQLLPGGAFQLTPLYDILSTWPIQGRGSRQIDPRKARLAMAIESRNRHYKLTEIQRRHWIAMAESLGLEAEAGALVDGLVEQIPAALDRLAGRLPAGFSERLFEEVANGVRRAGARLGDGLGR